MEKISYFLGTKLINGNILCHYLYIPERAVFNIYKLESGDLIQLSTNELLEILSGSGIYPTIKYDKGIKRIEAIYDTRNNRYVSSSSIEECLKLIFMVIYFDAYIKDGVIQALKKE